MIPDANVSPNIPEYPEIADHKNKPLTKFTMESKDLERQANDAPAKSALYCVGNRMSNIHHIALKS